jgi:hypothetical protein
MEGGTGGFNAGHLKAKVPWRLSMLMAALKESVNAAAALRPVTGNGSTPVNGRGLKHRKLTDQQRVALAADIATGSRPYVPSLAETCSALNVPVAAVRAELKARAATNGNGCRDVEKQFLEAWDLLSDAQRRQAFRDIGTAEIWDVLSRVV